MHGSAADGPSAVIAACLAEIATDVAVESDQLNRLDGVAGDGDLGVTVGTAARTMRDLAPLIANLEVSDAIRRMGTELARQAPSTGGTLVAFAFMAAAKALAASDAALRGDPTRAVAIAVAAASASVAERGRVAVGDKTMLDALDPAARALAAAADDGVPLATALRAAADAADAGARGTTEMRATVGRAGWLVERSHGHEDAGARFVALAFASSARCVGH
jgi:dihydroxyacetone kinase-like protein